MYNNLGVTLTGKTLLVMEGVASAKEIMGTRILQRSRACRQDIAAFREIQGFGGLFREFMEICNILVPKVSKPRQDIAAFREFCDFGRLFREISPNLAIS